jgi:lipopolysaccharide/colanic/teichoic acid biosynthesis glycosyltransferase
VLKRTTDVVFATVLLASVLPLLAFAALLIKMDSEGPVIFCQPRMGRRFRRFQLYKLRTMNLTAGGSAYTLGADPRITRVGRWLRLYKVDELPQLWNVLRGEMSMVGPRPVIPQLAQEFDWAYARLLIVRPGLTDPASLKYSNEAEILERVLHADNYFKTVITPDKIRISQDYLLHANSGSDLAIVMMTALALISPAYRRSVSQKLPLAQKAEARLLSFPQRLQSVTASPVFENASTPLEFDVPAVFIDRSRRSNVEHQGKSISI